MLINVVGEYKGKDSKGIIIGGKPFAPNVKQDVLVDETTFQNLKDGNENGWFAIYESNYDEFLVKMGRTQDVAEETSATEEIPATEETPAEEETPASEETHTKKRAPKKTAKKDE